MARYIFHYSVGVDYYDEHDSLESAIRSAYNGEREFTRNARSISLDGEIIMFDYDMDEWDWKYIGPYAEVAAQLWLLQLKADPSPYQSGGRPQYECVEENRRKHGIHIVK